MCYHTEKAKNEIRIFKNFAEVCPYSIDLNSVEKIESERKPDILCNLSDGSTIAFELVQCIDKSIAQVINDLPKLRKAFDDNVEKLPKEKGKQFKDNFGNASIFVHFKKEITMNKKLSSIPKIIDYLLSLLKATEGELDLCNKNLKNIIRRIVIDRREFRGPIFDVGAATSFTDLCKETIECKFAKNYEIKCRLELLAYYDLQPELIPENCWLPSVKKFIKEKIESSKFQRVWIYSVTRNKIMFVYPGLDPERKMPKGEYRKIKKEGK